jgi:hypothetical protein
MAVGRGTRSVTSEAGMRKLLERLDSATTPDREIAAHLDILAHLIAAQTLVAAAAAQRRISDNGTRNWIDAVAGDPSTVLNEIRDAGAGATTVGARAEKIAEHLLTMPVWKSA